MELSGKEPFHDSKVLLKFYKLWPDRTTPTAWKIIMILPIVFLALLPLALYLLYVDESVIEHLNCLAELLSSTFFYVKCGTPHYFNEEMCEVLDQMNVAWQKARREGSQERRKNLEKTEIENRNIHRYYSYTLTMSAINYVCVPITLYAIKKYIFNWDAEFSFGVHNFFVVYADGTSIFWFVVLLSATSVVYFCNLYGVFNGFYPILMNTCAALFTQTRMQLEELAEKFTKLSDFEITEELKMIVADHRTAIEISKKLESLMNPIFMIQYMVLAAVVVLVSFIMSMMLLTDFVSLLGKISFAFVSWLDLYMVCAYGDKVLQQSTKIADTAYFTDWYKKGKEVRRFTLFIIQRSQRPVGFTIGRFYFASLDRFAQVLRSSMSYLTLMRSLFA